MKKFLLSLCFIFLLCSRSFAFSDTGKHWAKEDINFCVEQGIMNGYPGDVFKPDNKVTRGEFLKIVTNLLPAETSNREIKTVDGVNWSEPFFNFLSDKNIISKSFNNRPSIPITRREAFSLLGRLLGVGDESLANGFLDSFSIDIKEEVGNLVKFGLVGGDENNQVNLDSNITRGEVCKIIHKMNENNVFIDYDYLRLNFIENYKSPSFSFDQFKPFSIQRKKSYYSLMNSIDLDKINNYLLNNKEYKLSIETLEYYDKLYNEKSKVVDDYKEIVSKISDLKEKFKGSDEEKVVKNIHDWMVKNIEYGFEEVFGRSYDDGTIGSDYNGDGKTKNGNSVYKGVTALLEGRAACNGYAELFQILAKEMGLKSIMVSGEAKSFGKDTWDGHAWNLVKVNGDWYHIDVTWDDPLTTIDGRFDPNYDNLRYTYYLISDDTMSRNHRWNEFYDRGNNIKFPKAPHDYPHNYKRADF